jgi:pantoate--beta-alanine ligase
MQIFRTVAEIRQALAADRKAGKRIGFVPTMGNLHEGHLQLVRQTQSNCDIVVVSIFVNPLQFGLNEDWEQYPRTFEADVEKLKSVGTNYLFYPTEHEMYPNGMATQTKVEVAVMTDILCGASRPGHFLGVTTVVAKLFNMVLPDEAVFGIKDFQQLAVIRRMAEDLCIPIQITAAPIARAEDGLALSSRNSYLTPTEKPVATQLYKTLCWAKQQIESGQRDYSALEKAASEKLAVAGMRPDYFSIIQQNTLKPAVPIAGTAGDTDIAILAAVYLGKTRLIDNVTLHLSPSRR